jgi:hypothetical protein
VLQVAAIAYWKGFAVLVATDTHRMHLLILGAVSEEFAPVLFDVKRALFEARYMKAKEILIDRDMTRAFTVIKNRKFMEAKPIGADLFDAETKGFPIFARVIPTDEVTPCAFYRIKASYLRDALMLGETTGVSVFQAEKNKPIVFRDYANSPLRWMAVVMPMHTD